MLCQDKLEIAIGDDAKADSTIAIDWMGLIMQLIQMCVSPAAAKEQIRKGGPVAFMGAMRVVKKKTDLRGKLARQKAAELVDAGKGLSDAELDELVADSQTIPKPPHGIFNLGLILFALLLFPTLASAQSGIFQIDVEQNRRLDVIEKKLDELIAKSRAVKPATAVGQAVAFPSVVKALQSDPMYEIVNGVRTHTSDDHLIAHGWKPEQFAGMTPDQKDRLHGAAHANGIEPVVSQARVTATIQSGYAQVCNGKRCRRIRLW